MRLFLFFQRFANGAPVPLQMLPVLEFLGGYGRIAQGRGDPEIVFADGEIADSGTIVRDDAGQVQCICLQRPRVDEPLRRFAHALMRRFDCCAFDDELGLAWSMLGSSSVPPPQMAAAVLGGCHRVVLPQQLWPAGLMREAEAPTRPALRYDNPNGAGPNYLLFDLIDEAQRLLTMHFATRPEACNPGTLRAIRNLLLRVDAAQDVNPDWGVLLRFNYGDTSLKTLKSPKLAETRNKAAILQPFGDEPVTVDFQPDFENFQFAVQQAQTVPETAARDFGLKLDGTPATLPALEQLLDQLHQRFRQGLGGKPPDDEYFNQMAGTWSARIGAYFGEMMRRELGGQWGQGTLMGLHGSMLRLNSGEHHCMPLLLALNRIINGRLDDLGRAWAALAAKAVPKTPRDQDLVSDLPAFCMGLMGKPMFKVELPFRERLPPEQFDFTLASLRTLDRYLLTVRERRQELDAQASNNIVACAGAYLGEVVRRNGGDRWNWYNHDDYFHDAEPPPGLGRGIHSQALLVGSHKVMFPMLGVIEFVEGARDNLRSFANEVIAANRGEEPPRLPPAPPSRTQH
jgi:hypothetical protein